MGHTAEESKGPCGVSKVEPLTPRQVQLLSTIAGFQSSRGYLPTIGELAQALNISRTTAFGHVEQLRKKELVSHLPKVARSLSLTARARKLLRHLDTLHSSSYSASGIERRDSEIPLVGAVAAGLPVEAVENKDSISMNSFFGSSDDVFALEVRGDSMTGADINNGDYVICRRSTTARDGEIVVALVDNENATLKRFYRQRSTVRLQPANDNYEPIYSDNCLIQGVVVGLVRKF